MRQSQYKHNTRDYAASRHHSGAAFRPTGKGRGAKWLPAALLLAAVLAFSACGSVPDSATEPPPMEGELPPGQVLAPEDASAEEAPPAAADVSMPQAGDEPAAGPEGEDVVLPVTDDAGQDYLAGTLFLGDSNTKNLIDHGLAAAGQVLAEPSIGIDSVLGYPYAAVPGVEGNVLVPEAVAALRPQRVLMTYGTNDVALYRPEEFVERYREAVAAIREASPGTVVIVNAIPPIGSSDAYARHVSLIQGFNAALLEMCKAEGIYFLNSHEALMEEDGHLQPAYRESDNFHMNAEGLAAMLNYYTTHAAPG